MDLRAMALSRYLLFWRSDNINWDSRLQVNNGNVEPHRGFGHIAVMTRDVYGECAALEADGVRFQKRPDEGKMKGIAFALDPDGWLP